MTALEFSTKIEHGQITLPGAYKSLENKLVRIIILSENELKPNTKKKLRKAFHSLSKVNSLSKIDNVVTWQSNLRNEWEYCSH